MCVFVARAHTCGCVCVQGAAGDIPQMTILLIEMTDYSNVQKVIKKKREPVTVFPRFFLFPLAENIPASETKLENLHLKEMLAFPPSSS